MTIAPPAPPALPITRFVGLDVSTGSVMVAAVDAKQQLLLPPKKIPLLRFQTWATQNLRPTDAVVLEATVNAWLVLTPKFRPKQRQPVRQLGP